MQGLLQQSQMDVPCSHGKKQRMCLPSPYKPGYIFCYLTDEFHLVMLTTGSGNYPHMMTGQSLPADDSSPHFVEHVTLGKKRLLNKMHQDFVTGPLYQTQMYVKIII
jgi:hypothetical protein